MDLIDVRLNNTSHLASFAKKNQITWSQYEKKYLKLLEQRNVINKIDPKILEDSCLLCSELKADKCHRRLAAEYIADKLNKSQILNQYANQPQVLDIIDGPLKTKEPLYYQPKNYIIDLNVDDNIIYSIKNIKRR